MNIKTGQKFKYLQNGKSFYDDKDIPVINFKGLFIEEDKTMKFRRCESGFNTK